jgi:transcriptional regulator with AAA-type ATPase domain
MKSFLQHISEQTEKQLQALSAANQADLQELPGKAGETAHHQLHKTINDILKQQDGDYSGQPEQPPMSDEELEKYYKSYTKKNPKSNLAHD